MKTRFKLVYNCIYINTLPRYGFRKNVGEQTMSDKKSGRDGDWSNASRIRWGSCWLMKITKSVKSSIRHSGNADQHEGGTLGTSVISTVGFPLTSFIKTIENWDTWDVALLQVISSNNHASRQMTYQIKLSSGTQYYCLSMTNSFSK